jgi:signal transduction histidine kinase/CheY-like chemotaxis protein
MLKQNLIHDGMEYANYLAYSSKLGVFAETPDLLGDPILGVMQSSKVVLVQVFTLKGKELKKMKRLESDLPVKTEEIDRMRKENTINLLKKTGLPTYFENNNEIEFWAPVISGSEYFEEETLYFRNHSSDMKNNIIGFVRVVLTTELLNASIRDILLRSILIMSFFMVLGWMVIRFIVKGITKHLDKLTKSVIAMGAGDTVEKVSVETEDEIGKLGLAFNNMVDSLRKMDIEKQKIEEQLRHAQKMEAIGTLAGGIAHDFNNTLSTIIGYGQLMRRRIDDCNSEKYLYHLLSSAKKAGSFIHSLLAFSRKEASNPCPENLNAIISDLEGILIRLLGEDTELKVETAGEDLVVLTEGGQIGQVLINLASNARDAMPDGGRLMISASPVELDRRFITSSNSEENNDYVLISVSDTGVGMDEQTKARIFEPFFTTKEVGKGTGLGLSMVYGIIGQHKGYIDVQSEEGEGTVFKIYLPLSKERVKEKREGLRTPKDGTETVLVAEDNDEFRELIKIVLEKKGYKVIEAVNGNDAVDKFIENKNDVEFLLLDMIMPKKNGNEAYQHIKQIKPDIKALFISGYTSHELHKKGCSKDNLDFLGKPVLGDDLIIKMRDMLDKQGS